MIVLGKASWISLQLQPSKAADSACKPDDEPGPYYW
jgi:hypothetical protein